MELLVLRNNLKSGLDALVRIVGGGSTTLPILRNFLIRVADGRLGFVATNLEIATTSFVSGKIVEPGGLTTPLGVFNSIINNLKDERIKLKKQGNSLIIKTDNYEAKIQGMAQEEFPIIPQIANKNFYLEIPTIHLRESLLAVVSAAHASETRPEISGALFDYKINALKIATTDTFRLAEKTIPDTQFKSNIEEVFKIIIPPKTIQEVLRVFKPEDSEKITIFIDPNQILFKTEKIEIISRLISGEFPNYEAIIPKDIEIEAVLNREELTQAIKLTSSFAENTSEVRLLIKGKTKNIEIFSASRTLGENRYLIPAKIKGGELEIVFNWRLLLDGFRGITSESVVLGLNSGNKPAIIKSSENPFYFYILMPIKSE